jgi:cation diffusion facilitator family transporter
MIKLLVRLFIKDCDNVGDRNVRERYGVLGGVLGICCNLVLFCVKLFIGMGIGSMAVMSDAFNNLSDMGSSLISILGAKMSNKRPDKEHPFGHGRFEYIASLIVAFIIMIVGFQLLTGSIDKIRNPEPMNFNGVLMVILGLSMLIKVWMFLYNRYLGKRINSSVLIATAQDSINDVAATFVVICATLISHFTHWYIIDGIMSLAVSLFIIYGGFGIAKDVIGTLLGTPPDPELVSAMSDMICGHSEIMGIHDLVVHDYGPGRIMASVHAEAPDNGDIVHVHEIIDDIEQDAMREFGVMLVIHMDPVSTDCEITNKLKQQVAEIVASLNPEYTIHDFRITDGQSHKNLIFDVVVTAGMTEDEKKNVRDTIASNVSKMDPSLRTVITIDTPYL